MAYCTPQDRAQMAANGWEMDEKRMLFYSERPTPAGRVERRHVAAAWEGCKVGNLDVPAPEKVVWIAYVIGSDDQAGSRVVPYAHMCPTPAHCLVMAELRQWKAH